MTVIGYAGLLVPGVVVLLKGVVENIGNLILAEGGKLLRGKELIHGHMHLAPALIQAVLGIGQVAALNMAHEHRYLKVLKQLCGAQGYGLVCAGYAAHTLREEAYHAAAFKDAGDFLYAVYVCGKVLFGYYLQNLKHQRQM